jgi:hypothetical protein
VSRSGDSRIFVFNVYHKFLKTEQLAINIEADKNNNRQFEEIRKKSTQLWPINFPVIKNTHFQNIIS